MSKRKVPVEQEEKYIWSIPQNYNKGMRVSGRIFADNALVQAMQLDRTLEQCANVAHLPGIYKYAITLPDGHEGYGFPIGGVAATDYEDGVISPGGVGYDINCGVRLLTTNLTEKEIRPQLKALTQTLNKNIPSGLGSSRRQFQLSRHDLEALMREGASWIIDKGLGWTQDAELCEEEGCLTEGHPDKVSDIARKRGRAQMGTLGSGNHFIEVGQVDTIYDPHIARIYGIHHKN